MATGYLGIKSADYSATYEGLLYCKTNIGGYFFDGVLNVSHSSRLTITQNPVETGASVVDHAYLNPAEITMKIVVSDVHQSIVPGQFGEGWRRHTSAWKILKKLQSDRIPVSVFTKLGLYDNMLIESLSSDDNYETIDSLIAIVSLREIPVATLKTVKISKADQTAYETELGKVSLQYLDRSNESMLYILNGGGDYYSSDTSSENLGNNSQGSSSGGGATR